MTSKKKLLITAAGAALALAVSGINPTYAGSSAQHPHHGHDGHDGHDELTQVAALDGPRGVDTLGHGLTVVTEGDGSFSLVVEREDGPARVIELGTVGGEFPPAIAVSPWRTVWILTGGGPPPEEERMGLLRGERAQATAGPPATLFKWRRGWPAPVAVADIAAYQATDPDPFNTNGPPEESNPFGVAALPQGGVLVADAAANDLLRVWPDGTIKTVALLKPRLVEVPEGLPELPPEQGGPLPPAGTPILAEAVATSVTVGHDGSWYVGELRGFPATPGTSQIWRIPPGTLGATCDPEHPFRGPCKRFADGLTSIVDLAPAPHHGILAVSLSKQSWLHWELGVEGAEIGGLFHVSRHPWNHLRIHELVPDQLTLPGGVDSSRGGIYVTGPIFGPGALWKVH